MRGDESRPVETPAAAAAASAALGRGRPAKRALAALGAADKAAPAELPATAGPAAAAKPEPARAEPPAAAPKRRRSTKPRADRQPRQPTRAQFLTQLVSRLKNAARRKRKDTAWRRSPAFALLQEKKALEAQRKAQLQQAAQEAEQLPLLRPPPWWAPLWAEAPQRRQQTSLRVELGSEPAAARLEWEVDPSSVFSLRLEPRSLEEVQLLWTFPPGNPGSSNAWIGLFHSVDGVHDQRGRLRYRLLTRDATSGAATYGAKFWQGLPDGEYLFALMADYGVESRALSQRFWLLQSRVVMVDAEPGGVALASVLDPSSRAAKRFALSSHALTEDERARDDEPQDERCYFPVPLVDVVLSREGEAAAAAGAGAQQGAGAAGAGAGSVISQRIRRTYQLTDKESYLDWGLSSDYDALGDERRTKAGGSAGEVYVPVDVARVMRTGKQTGLGGNTHGSEGYGEATIGSVHKLVLLLQNLRQLILSGLFKDAQWNPLYDLTPLSTFLDIGSGYGKVVVHAKLEAKVRRCVGIECVQSRHVIAQKVLAILRTDLSDETYRTAAERYAHEAGAEPEGSAPARQPGGCEGASAAGASRSDATSLAAVATANAATEALEAWGVPACVDLRSLSMPFVKDTDLYRGIELRHDDATRDDRLSFTHIYVFDRVFSKRTLIALAQVLTRSPFLVFVSFRPCHEWWRYGLVKVQPVAKLNCRTTGKEGCNAYVYINLERAPGFKAPKDCCGDD